MARLVVCYNPSTQMFSFRCEDPPGAAVPAQATLGNISGLTVNCGGDMVTISGFQNLSEGEPVPGTIVKYEINNSGSVLKSVIQVDNTGACPPA